MEPQDASRYIISKLRSITTAVQIMPFIYAFLFIVALLAYLFASEKTMVILDTFLYVSPIVTVGNLIQSRILKLCRWHKVACILPVFPQINILIDRYIYEFSVRAELAHSSLVIIMSILLLIAAYNVFFK